jgi:DNA-binding LacI/PurR family transcriptional regulator
MGRAPAACVPRLGVLYGGPANQAATDWCRHLHAYYAGLAAVNHCVLTTLGCTMLPAGTRVPWDLEPTERESLTPGPLPEQIRGHGFDGLVAIGIFSNLYLAEIARLGLPMIVLDFETVGANCDSVVFDSVTAGRFLGQLLAATGHKQIMFASLYSPDPTARRNAESLIEDDASIDRRLGVLQGLEGSAATLWPTFPLWSSETIEERGRRLTGYLEAQGRLPDAVTGHGTKWVGRLWDLMRPRAAASSRPVSLVAFDSDPPTNEMADRISHMQFPWIDMAVAGWRLLTERIHAGPVSPPPRTERIPARYVDRGTVLQHL